MAAATTVAADDVVTAWMVASVRCCSGPLIWADAPNADVRHRAKLRSVYAYCVLGVCLWVCQC